MSRVGFLTRSAIMFKSRLPELKIISAGIMNALPHLLCALMLAASCLPLFALTADASDVERTLGEMQKRYASVRSLAGSFVLINRAPQGIEQVESGLFWIKKPALMRWEYSNPEGMLFVSDGKKCFLYDPQERQVTVQSLTTEELLNTPLKFLLGAVDFEESFYVGPEDEIVPQREGLQMIRLEPKSEKDYTSLALGIDSKTFDLVQLVIREQDGNTREYFFKDLKTDVKIKDKDWFTFKIPEGVEVYGE